MSFEADYRYQLSEITIDLGKLRDNLIEFRTYLNDNTRQMAVIKADAYGHGAVKVAKAIENIVSWLAVNDPLEGVELRKNGIELPVLVFGTPSDQNSDLFKEYNLTATISAFHHFKVLKAGTKYHINFDTGMCRLGFDSTEAVKVGELMNSHNHLICEGIYSHFATADDPESPKAQQQVDLFKEIRRSFPGHLITHMANTGGTVFYPESHFDMVRLGLGMYGYYPGKFPIENIKPILSWRSKLIQVKSIRQGDTVSYGALWECPKDGYIGVVPVGYEEGIPRSLTGNMEVVIGGQTYPVVGAVTMNYIMVYFGDDKPNPGVSVELMGGGAETAKEWAKKAGTIPYEILTNISGRIKRNYVTDR